MLRKKIAQTIILKQLHIINYVPPYVLFDSPMLENCFPSLHKQEECVEG